MLSHGGPVWGGPVSGFTCTGEAVIPAHRILLCKTLPSGASLHPASLGAGCVLQSQAVKVILLQGKETDEAEEECELQGDETLIETDPES